MPDAFSSYKRGLSDPAETIFDIVPNDTADLPHVTLALNVTTPGMVRVTMADDSISEVSIHPGAAFPLRVKRVWLTGTTATGIHGLA